MASIGTAPGTAVKGAKRTGTAGQRLLFVLRPGRADIRMHVMGDATEFKEVACPKCGFPTWVEDGCCEACWENPVVSQ